jgi:ElaB/YqjD/DUF883 family membrane-anchored ribosome-binding protein
MNDLEKAEQSGKEHMKAAAEDFKAAATGKIEDLRQTAEEFRQTPADKAKAPSSAAEQAWSSAISKGQDWLVEGEAYVRKNPAQAVLIALGLGNILGNLPQKVLNGLRCFGLGGSPTVKSSAADSIRDWIASFLRYLELRLRLFGLEALVNRARPPSYVCETEIRLCLEASRHETENVLLILRG